MKTMKRFAALGLAAMMVMGMGMPAAAAATRVAVAEPNYTDVTTVDIEKTYELVGAGVSPAETFTVSQQGDGEVRDGDAASAPALVSITSVSYVSGAAGDADQKTGKFTVTLPTYANTGVYEYTLVETAGDTAGVTYRTTPIRLVVTVVEEDGLKRIAAVHAESEDSGVKTSSFADNTYSAGSLSVTKEVTGNLGDKTKEFEVTVTFTAPEGKTVRESITYNDGEEHTIEAGEDGWTGKKEVKINVRHGETVTFPNIPYGVTYTVEEADYTTDAEGYDKAEYSFSDQGETKIIDNAEETVEITNNKESDVDTGISLDNLPYIMILAVIMIAGMVFVISRRRREEY